MRVGILERNFPGRIQYGYGIQERIVAVANGVVVTRSSPSVYIVFIDENKIVPLFRDFLFAARYPPYLAVKANIEVTNFDTPIMTACGAFNCWKSPLNFGQFPLL